MAVRGHGRGLEAALVADVTAAIQLRVAVDELAVVAGLRHPDAVALAHDRRPVQHRDDPLATVPAAPDERNHARLMIRAVDPREARRLEVDFPERRPLPVE